MAHDLTGEEVYLNKKRYKQSVNKRGEGVCVEDAILHLPSGNVTIFAPFRKRLCKLCAQFDHH